MRSVTVEPVVFSYVFTGAMIAPLLQQYIYDELSKEHNFTKADDNRLCINGSDNSGNVTALENRIQTQASYWFIALSVSCKCKGLIPRALFLGEMRIISPVSFEL
jgi:hypothetical protein